MIVCPVCEHPQDKGDTCDVCGKRLVAAPPTAEQYPTLPELEQTALMSKNAVGPPITLMPELEVHRVGEVSVGAEKMVELEATTIAGAGAAVAPGEVVADLERTNLAPAGERTVLGATLTCRYCGHVQARSNVLCDRCANALPRPPKAPAASAEASTTVKCIGCGVDAVVGRNCPSCGFFIRPPET